MIVQKAGFLDVATLGRMNLLLIRDSGHRNPMNQAQLARRMRKWMEGEYTAYLIKIRELPVGYCLCRKEKEFLYIRQFFIERAYRNRGLGRRAFHLLRKKAWKKAVLLRMDVLVGNKTGIRFWKALGFKDYCLTMEKNN
jgi:predicted acetyltransferase